MEGHCLCGAVTVKVNDDNLFGSQRRGHLCHCTNCRKVAGGLFGHNFTIETSKVQIIGEENMSVYNDPDTTSGTPVARWFCKTCGNPIRSLTPVFEGMTVLKLGLYDKVPVPEWESFVVKRQAFEKPWEGCIQYKTKSRGDVLDH